jgi:plastocyanin
MTALNYFRIIPRDADFLNRKTGSRGEIFFDEDSNSLRLYDGANLGGIALLRADLENLEAQISTVIPSSTPPVDVDPGTVWFNTNNGKIYIYFNDGDSNQWVQPTTPSVGGGGGGGGASDFSGLTGTISLGQIANNLITPAKLNLSASLIPNANIAYDLGSSSFRWRDLYLSGSSINLGSAVITASGSSVVLPAGSTVAGSSILGFSTIEIAGQSNIVADTSSDTLTLVAGPGIQITTNSETDTITITNTGGGGGGSGVSSGTVNRLAWYAATGSVVSDTGSSLTWNGTNLNITGTITASGAVSYTRAYFDTLTALNQVSPSTWHGMVAHVHDTGRMYFAHAGQWTPLANYSDISHFSTIAIAGQSSVVAETASDTLTLIAGSNITLSTNASADSITISSNAISLDGLSDVTITSPTVGQILKYNGSIWINDTDATGGGAASNSFETIAVAGQSSVVADSSTDTLTLVAGSNITITTNASTDTITISAAGGGGAASNSFETIAVAGQSNVVADSSTDTLTLVAGTGISITTNASTDAITITNTVSAGATAFTGLSDSAGLTIDKIYLPAITMLTTTNNGVSSYRFDQYGASDNPTIYAISGTTIAFNLSVASHPFLIQTSGGTNYDTGLVHVSTSGSVNSGSAAQGQTSGTLYWKVPNSISGNYRYQCANHGGMVGTITVKSFAGI